MLITKLDEVLSKTAEITGYKPEVVASVMSHTFQFLVTFLKRPTAAGIRFAHFGVIRGSLASLNTYLRRVLIKSCRTYPERKEVLQHL